MNNTGNQIEKIGHSVNLVIDFMKRNSDVFRKNYTFEQIFMQNTKKRLMIKIWLENCGLNVRIVNAKKKRVEMYVQSCKMLAIRFTMR